jgi:hypothetical protein
MYRKLVLAAGAILAGLVGPGWGQAPIQPSFEHPTQTETPRSGLRIHSATVYTGYVSTALPNSYYNYLSGAVPVGPDLQSGGAVSIRWTRYKPWSSMLLNYEPSFDSLAQHSEWNAFNHSLTFTGNRRWERWDFSANASGRAYSLNQYLFAPTALSTLTGTRGSFEDLAGAVMSGRYTNDQLASMLTGSPPQQSPADMLLFGNRVLSGSVSAALSYRWNTRKSLRIAAGSSRSQYLRNGNSQWATMGMLNNTTTGNVSVGYSFSLTPSTDFGLEAMGSRNASNLQDGYLTSIAASVGRKFGRRWFVQGRGGPAIYTSVRSSYRYYKPPEGLQYVAGGNLGYTTASHSFVAHFDRSPADPYGIGAGYTISSGGSWAWQRPTRPWALSASVSQQRMRAALYQQIDGWLNSVVFSRMLSRQVIMQISYSYLSNSGMYLGSARDITLHAVQVAFLWARDGGK